MSVLALHQHADELGVRRYGGAAIAIVLVYAAMIAAALLWYQRAEPVGVNLQPILVELAPAPAAEQLQTQDQGPNPLTQQAEAPPPEPIKREMIEELPPTPPKPEATVAAPLKVEPKVEPVKEKPEPVRDQTKKPVMKQRLEESKAARADRVGPKQPSPVSGASAAAAAASYRSLLASHLQRFKQYPADARGRGEQGVASVTFTTTRDGRVTSSRLAKSSGYPALDRETVALVQRAQPLPAFPPEVAARSDTFTVPFSYTIR